MTTRMTLSAARTARNAGLPWATRVEFRGSNYDNQSGRSSKFWSAEGVGHGSVTIRWGRIGSAGQSTTKGWAYFEKKLYEKLDKGYSYPFSTVSKAPTPQKAQNAPVAAPKPAPAPTPTPALKAPVAAPAASQSIPGLPATPAAPSLPGPFGLVAGLRAIKTGFEALDTKGCKLMVLTFEGGRQLSQEHDVPVLGI